MDNPPATSNQAIARLRDADQWRLASSMATHPSSCDGGEPLVVAIAGGLAAVSVPWNLASPSPATQHSQLLLATDRYDAWLVYWPVGSALAMPDRLGAAGAFGIVDGVLDDEMSTGSQRLDRSVGRGDIVAFGDGAHHLVLNRGDRGATSVHVYSPPLSSFGVAGSNGPNPTNSWSEVA